jgi:hypothetical protein
MNTEKTMISYQREGSMKPLNLKDLGKAQMELLNLYGDPRKLGWGNKWMVIWNVKEAFPWFPAHRIYLHKDFRTKLQIAFKALESKGLHKEIKSFDGCYNLRMVRGSSSTLSLHAWGVAIDLNAHDNPMGGQGTWTGAFIKTMKESGIYCGQSWAGRKDPMHFALLNG